VFLANNFGSVGSWQMGNFTGTPTVDFDDFVVLANNFSMKLETVAPAAAAAFAASQQASGEGPDDADWWWGGDEDTSTTKKALSH
jgi:hypothetical protein